jgi:phospholipid/cholesterol/gamma-HCH transport system substrate-binding protein
LKKSGKDPVAPVPADGWLQTAMPADPMGDMQRAAQEAKGAMNELRRATEGIADERFKEDLHGTVASLRVILDGVAVGDGMAHRFVFDQGEAKRIDAILSNLEATSSSLARVSADAEEITKQVKSGSGLAHAVVYDDQLAQGTTGSMVELNKSLQAVRTGNGLAHAFVYGDDQTQHLMGNVNAVSDDLREIVANVKAGRGTVGALLVDPTVYEDVKALVGNVERNEVLRALVRYSIKQNEEHGRTDVKIGGGAASASK